MNISCSEFPLTMIAKTCSCKYPSSSSSSTAITSRKVTYTFVDSFHVLCIDKKDIILAEIQASEELLEHTYDLEDRQIIEKEISQLKMSVDLIS